MRRIFERISDRFGMIESSHQKIVNSFIWISLFVVVGKFAGAAKEMTIAWRYGISAKVDAYVFILNLVNWPISVWFSILTVVLLPLLARLRGEAESNLPKFRSELLAFTIILGVMLGLAAWLGLPILLREGLLGLTGEALSQALNMTNGLAFILPLGTVISLFSAWLLANGHHRNTLFEAIPALVLLVTLLIPYNFISEPLVWGTVAGFAFHAVALALPIQRRGELPAPRLTFRSPAWQFFWSSIGIMALGQMLTSLTGLVDQFLIAGLDTGSLSTLSYTNRVLALIVGLGATAVSRATLPVFSSEVGLGGNRVVPLALTWFKWMLIFGIIVFIVSWMLAPWAINILFERGAFTAENTRSVASLLRYALFQVIFIFPALVLVSALAAQRRHKLIALSGAINFVIKIPLAFVLVRYYDLHGLMLSTVLMYAISTVVLYLMVTRSVFNSKLTSV
jgi:putative peptidoglycan lipid II flippase